MQFMKYVLSITDEFFGELQKILNPGLFTELANGFAHYADSDVIRKEYSAIGDEPEPQNDYERHAGVVTYSGVCRE